MYVDNSACVRVKGGESERFTINSRGETGVYHPPGCSMYI